MAKQKMSNKIRSDNMIRDFFARVQEVAEQSFIDTEKESISNYTLTGWHCCTNRE
jgi:hypothetical protein